MKLDDIENAYLFVSMSPEFSNSAIICKDTGEIYYVSEMGDSDDLPDDIDDSDKYIEIPHKNGLDLGKNLVFEFVSECMPDGYDDVVSIFRRKGAYSRFKELLDNRGLLDKWYRYEDERQKAALRQWCEDNDIEVEG